MSIKIVLDGMGGDNAPAAVVRGALDALKDFPDCELILTGRQEDLMTALKAEGQETVPERMTLRDCREVIEMCDDPSLAFRRKKDSSMTVGLNMVKDGEGDAFISAGSTGALLSAATLIIRRPKGILRAAVAPVIPTGSGTVLIDAGTNAECKPEYLLQFGYMGAFYAESVLGKQNPKVALLNIGAEPGKGDTLHKEAFDLLMAEKEAGRLNFVGNIESREAVAGEADVVVADGFSGNIFLKAVEGTAIFMSGLLKKSFTKSIKTKLGYLLSKDGVNDLKKVLDYREVGGSCILGINKPVVKAHGSSDARAFYCAIRQARSAVKGGVSGMIAENAARMNANGEN